jgi:signal transduction histidine kinase
VRVANDIGQGRLDTRVTLRRSRYGEIAILADAINDMAARIQKQMRDQRELLAAVSHEIRSPLSRMRLLLELARDSREKNALGKQLDGMERELIEINELTGKLLASSRLDFSALETRELDARTLALGALERASLSSSLLEEPAPVHIAGDPTLLSRALSNLLENAVKYGGGPTELRITTQGGHAEFTVRDGGPGFQDAELPNVFESFVRGAASSGGGSLGLGLALVRRIALAHGGRVWARNGSPIGAEVGFSVPLSSLASSPKMR